MARKRRQSYSNATDDVVQYVPKKTRRGVTLVAVPLVAFEDTRSSRSTTQSRTPSPSKAQSTSASPTKSHPNIFPEDVLPPDPPWFESKKHPRKSVGKSQNDFIREWLPHRNRYIDEILNMEGRGMTRSCSMCTDRVGVLRCIDCIQPHLLCNKCCLISHTNLPFHRLEKWSGQFFEMTDLTAEGFVMHLGHNGNQCRSHDHNLSAESDPRVGPSGEFENISGGQTETKSNVERIIVVDVLGIHAMMVSWCRCDGSEDKHIQLLRARLFPTSLKRPASAFTFQVLDYFHIDSVECKTSALTFYSKLRRLTNYISPEDVPDRYRELMRISRQWRNIKALMRAGFGHDITRMRTPGDLAIFCPACPQPGINLPHDWSHDPERWLYWRSIVVDGNFKAEHLKMRNPSDDVSLTDGDLYMVSPDKYEHHLQHAKENYTRSKCNNHKAVNKIIDSRRHLQATGIGAVACARHGCFFPHSVVDFQKGERHMNVDYAICETLQQMACSERVLTIYDIACQWSVHFDERVEAGDMLDKPPLQTIVPAIGKFHLGAHVPECFPKFTLNFIKGAGQIDGEILETLWWPIDKIASATRAMTKAHRREVLDDNMYDSNWKKWVGIADMLVRKYKKAVEMEGMMLSTHDELTKTLHEDWIAEWTIDEARAMRERGDAMKVFTVQESQALSQAEARVQLEDKADMTRAGDSTISWLTTGLAIQEAQIKLKLKMSKLGARLTRTQQDDIDKCRAQLRDRLASFHHEAASFIPFAVQEEIIHMSTSLPDICGLFEDDLESTDVHSSDEESIANDLDLDQVETDAESAIVLLPSTLTRDLITSLALGSMADEEALLREGQANDALGGLRAALGEKALIFRTQVRNAKSTKKTTKSWDAVHRINGGIKMHLQCYHVAREALKRLDVHEDVLRKFQEIKKEDLRMSGDIIEENRFGQKNEIVPWFWRQGNRGLDEDDGWMKDSEIKGKDHRVTWLRSKARLDRWSEETVLLKKEMEWTLATFNHCMEIWTRRIGDLDGEDGKEGHVAFAWREIDQWGRFITRAKTEFSEVI